MYLKLRDKSLQRRPDKSSFMFRCESEMARVFSQIFFPPWAPPENWFNLPSLSECSANVQKIKIKIGFQIFVPGYPQMSLSTKGITLESKLNRYQGTP